MRINKEWFPCFALETESAYKGLRDAAPTFVPQPSPSQFLCWVGLRLSPWPGLSGWLGCESEKQSLPLILWGLTALRLTQCRLQPADSFKGCVGSFNFPVQFLHCFLKKKFMV